VLTSSLCDILRFRHLTRITRLRRSKAMGMVLFCQTVFFVILS